VATDVAGQVRRGETDIPGSLQYMIFGPSDGSFIAVAEDGDFAVARNADCVEGAYWTADYKNPLPTRRQGKARLKQYRPHHFQVESKAAMPGYLIVPMQYQRGWQVEVNGRPERFRLVRGVMPAVAVPAGTAVVTFTYQPPYWRLGLAITGAALLAFFGLWLVRRRSSQAKNTQPGIDQTPSGDVRNNDTPNIRTQEHP
jgi:hypothetical protein